MALTVGICDDSPEQIELLRGYLRRFKDSPGLTVVSSTDPQEFLALLTKNKPDLLFLDIDMDQLNGIQLGEKIRTAYADAVIIYITAYEEYALEAFRVRAFHYLLKPLTGEKFAQVLQEALALLKKSAGEKSGRKYFPVQRKGEIIMLDYAEIAYFEKIGHKIIVHACDRDCEFYGNFNRLLETLEPDCFVQCHQGYIVNLTKIRGYRDKTLFLEGNAAIPVGRTYSVNIKEVLARRLFSGEVNDEAHRR